MSEPAVDLDPALADGLDRWHLIGAEVHVLRARAEGLRGPRRGERALVLALRASDLEAELLSTIGVEAGAAILRVMEEHPATLAAVERWRYAQLLAERITTGDLSGGENLPGNDVVAEKAVSAGKAVLADKGELADRDEVAGPGNPPEHGG